MLTESAELVALAAESGLVAGVNYNMRFYPLNLEARARVQSGELGDIFTIHGSYVQDWLLYPSDYNWRVLADEGGALRAVADIGTHWLDLVTSITGLDVEAVFADLSTVHPVRQRPNGEVETFSGKVQEIDATEPIDIETEDCGSILLRLKGGATADLWVSQVTAGRKNCLRYEIGGSAQALAWNSEQPNELWIGHRNRPNELLLRDPAWSRIWPAPLSPIPAATTKAMTIRSSSASGHSMAIWLPAISLPRPLPDLRRWAQRDRAVRSDPEESSGRTVGLRERFVVIALAGSPDYTPKRLPRTFSRTDNRQRSNEPTTSRSHPGLSFSPAHTTLAYCWSTRVSNTCRPSRMNCWICMAGRDCPLVRN